MKFTFIEFNDRREQRGAPAARVEVTYDDGESEWLWMSKRDIAKNLRAFGPCGDLEKAHDAYSDPRHMARTPRLVHCEPSQNGARPNEQGEAA